MALRTHFNQPEIGCPGIAEFTVQRTEALFDHITGLRQISVAFGLRFRQRTVAVGFAHNAVQQPMFFQMLPVFRSGKRSMCLAIMACAVCWKKVLMRNPLNVLVGI